MKRNTPRLTLLTLSLLLGLTLLSSGCQRQTAATEQSPPSQEAAAPTSEAPTQEAAAQETPPPTEETTASTSEASSQEAQLPTEPTIDADGSYTTMEDVSLYLHTYDRLPSNFITKKEARALGWEGGSLEPYAPGKCIGGDVFGNYEALLPTDASYHECDIDTLGQSSRGAKRLVYDDDGSIYYTDDHYGSFSQIY